MPNQALERQALPEIIGLQFVDCTNPLRRRLAMVAVEVDGFDQGVQALDAALSIADEQTTS